METLAVELFGPEYANAVAEVLGTFEVDAQLGHTAVSYSTIPNIRTDLLPSGGYVIRYVSGSFLLLGATPVTFVVGGQTGLWVRWRTVGVQDWTEAPFPLEIAKNKQELPGLFYLELTRPHQMELVAPSHSAGNVKLRVVRYSERN